MTLSAKVEFIGTAGDVHRKAVLLLRQSLDPHAVSAGATRHGDGLTSLEYRETVDADTHEIETASRDPHRLPGC